MSGAARQGPDWKRLPGELDEMIRSTGNEKACAFACQAIGARTELETDDLWIPQAAREDALRR
jgi:hypothetical protein